MTLTAFSPAAAQAATLGVYTHDYGKNRYVPRGNDDLRGNFVEINETTSNPFFDSFDFSGLAYKSIERLTLTLEFDRAGPSAIGIYLLEAWDVKIAGSNASSTSDDFSGRLNDRFSPQDFILDAASNAGPVDAFTTALATQKVDFWFDEPGFFNVDTFRLYSATLTVTGVSAVPLPAPFWLLLSALGGLGVMRRRRSRVASPA